MIGAWNYMMGNMNTKDNQTIFHTLITSLPSTHYLAIHEIHNVEFRKKWGLPTRRLNDYVLAFIRSGNGQYTINGNLIPFEAGHIFLISPNSAFSAEQHTQTPSLLSIRFNVFHHVSKQIAPIPRPFFIHLIPESMEHYRTLFHKAYSSFLSSNSLIKENAYISLIMDAIDHDLRYQQSCKTYDLRLESAKVFVQKNPTKPISVKHMSDLSGLSLPYFSKKFREQYGLTPKAFLFKTHMEHAKLLLTEYRYSVGEVADILHYSDSFIFSNQYKKHWGYPPSKTKRV